MSSALDEIIHPPHRLQICAMLVAVDSMAFATVREALQLSESALSKQIKVLQTAGYVTLTKRASRAHLRTWIALTPSGRRALAGHLTELQRIAHLAEQG